MARKTEKQVSIVISAYNRARSQFRDVERGLKGIKDRVFSLKTALAGLGLGILARDLVQASNTQRRAIAGLETALKSMGRYTPELSAGLQQVASDLQQVSNYGDEATMEGMKFLVTYRDITDDLLPRSSSVMQDLAALMGGDLTQAANMLGKASMGMTGELRRAGITVDSNTFKTKGYAGVLAEIESQVKGQARAIRDASGPWTALSNVFGDIKEKGGDLINDVFGPLGEELVSLFGALDGELADLQDDESFKKWAEKSSDAVVDAFEEMLIGGARVVDEFKPLVSEIAGSVDSMWEGFRSLPTWVQEIGILGALIGGKKGRQVLMLGALAAGAAVDFAKGAEAWQEGDISFGEWAGSDDIEALLESKGLNEKPGPMNMGNVEEPGKRHAIGGTYNAGTGQYEPEAETAEARVRAFLKRLRERRADRSAAGSGGGSGGGGGGTTQVSDDLLQEWQKLRAELTFEGVKAGMNEYERRIADLALKAAQMRQEYKDIEGADAEIDTWLKGKIAEVQTDESEKKKKKAAEAELERLKRLEEQAEETYGAMTEFGVQAAHNLQTAFADAIFNSFEEGLDGMLDSWVKTLRRMLAEIVANQMLTAIFNGMAGSSNAYLSRVGTTFGGQIKKHDGGLVVPRFHGGGLLPGEVPIIAQSGERVLSREQSRLFEQMAKGAGAGTVVQIQNNGPGQARAERGKTPDGRELIKVVIDEVDSQLARGRFDRSAGLSWGVQRQGR